MELFIRITNGEPDGHPILEDNFRQAFPDVDVDNLPPEFARFKRVQAPRLGVYEKNQRVQYELGDDGIYRDVWYCDPMTADDILAKQNEFKAIWAEDPDSPQTWIFNEATCDYDSPIPYPNDGKKYAWNNDIANWEEIPPQDEEVLP